MSNSFDKYNILKLEGIPLKLELYMPVQIIMEIEVVKSIELLHKILKDRKPELLFSTEAKY